MRTVRVNINRGGNSHAVPVITTHKELMALKAELGVRDDWHELELDCETGEVIGERTYEEIWSEEDD